MCTCVAAYITGTGGTDAYFMRENTDRNERKKKKLRKGNLQNGHEVLDKVNRCPPLANSAYEEVLDTERESEYVK